MAIAGQSQLFLLPALALVAHTLMIWVALVMIRPRAMIKAGVPWQAARHTADLTDLPGNARDVADNYNHLMEQPTIFYAVLAYTWLAGNGDAISLSLAWFYVAVRMIHSAEQLTYNRVPIRFWLFFASTMALFGLVASNLVHLAV